MLPAGCDVRDGRAAEAAVAGWRSVATVGDGRRGRLSVAGGERVTRGCLLMLA